MSHYTYQRHSVETPIGSIMQYYGPSDPDGWVICDGQLRTCTDNRYTYLAIFLHL